MDGVAGPRLSAPDRLDRPFADPLVLRLFPPLATGVHWGLERTVRALESLGDPHRAYPTIHVGGTNGKGSVASTLSSVLNASGLMRRATRRLICAPFASAYWLAGSRSRRTRSLLTPRK